jgi:hypothetical protein
MQMATAPTPLRDEQESDMLTARQPIPIQIQESVEKRSSINPVLTVILIALAAYPFVVGYLPDSVRQYLGSLFN